MATDEDALVCDFAETYHIYDYRQLPPRYAATLAAGLREGSRIRTALSGLSAPLPLYLQMAQVDALNLIAWLNSTDAVDGTNRPKSILQALTANPNDAVQGYKSGEDFIMEWKRRTEGK